MEDDLVEPAIDTRDFQCGRPFELTQDCSPFSYALREIAIGDLTMKVAASEDGDIVLVNSATPWKDCLSNILMLNCPSLGRKANEAYVVLRDFLVGNGIKVKKAVPLTSWGSTIGYYVFMDGNGYETLKTLSTADTGEAATDSSSHDNRKLE